uniref:DNA2/NAM7 helicase helicase domain-containing protein n=1 Tax=Ditylenchus dipsaci TaxID=166011 RepID=A0A915CYP4_9BILA
MKRGLEEVIGRRRPAGKHTHTFSFLPSAQIERKVMVVDQQIQGSEDVSDRKERDIPVSQINLLLCAALSVWQRKKESMYVCVNLNEEEGRQGMSSYAEIKKETKVYPGGLVAVNDFEDVDVPEAITRMIKAKLSVESFGSEEQRQEAEQIIEVLKSTPRSLEEYVQRLTIYNQFSYAHDEVNVFSNLCWSGRVISVKIVNVDLAKGHVFVVLADKVPEINISQPYKLFLATSPFNFCTRHRVLTSIIADIQHNIVFPQLPKDMIPRSAIIGIMRASPSIPYICSGPQDRQDNYLGGSCCPVAQAQHNKQSAGVHALQHCCGSICFGFVKDRRRYCSGRKRSRRLSNFGFEPKKQIQKQYRVIVSTLSASSYLVSGGLKGNFSHIIVDEAGQADELDTLIPIVGLADKNTRSYALLVKTPSKLFYDGRLIASAVQSQKSTLCNWSGLPIKNVPLIFHSVSDVEEKRKRDSLIEISKKLSYLRNWHNFPLQVPSEDAERKIVSPTRNANKYNNHPSSRANGHSWQPQEFIKSKSWKKVIEFCQDKKALIGDLDSPLEVVHKKKRNKFLKKKKNQPVLLEENKQKKIDDLDKSSLNASNQTRSKVTIKQVSQQNQAGP